MFDICLNLGPLHVDLSANQDQLLSALQLRQSHSRFTNLPKAPVVDQSFMMETALLSLQTVSVILNPHFILFTPEDINCGVNSQNNFECSSTVAASVSFSISFIK